MYIVGLAFCTLAVHFGCSETQKAGACALFGIGLVIPAIMGKS
jgi:hypothetical protein